MDLASSPLDGWAYRAGEAIDIVVSLDARVEVEGSPRLSLYLGDSGSSSWRGATYHSGSGTREVVFRYRVKPDDLDLDGISVASAATGDDGAPAYGFAGTINAAGTDVPIDYAHPGISPLSEQRVDGRPYVQRTRIRSAASSGVGACSGCGGLWRRSTGRGLRRRA